MKLSLSLVTLAIAACGTAQAQQAPANYPSRPIRIIVASPPGGATDIQARLFTSKLRETMNKAFVVENISGPNEVGFAQGARAAPDGHTVLAVTPSFTFGPALVKDLPYDPVKAFAPVSIVTKAPYVMLVHPSLPVHNVKEWVAYAKANPKTFSVAMGGVGSFTHLAAAWLAELASLDVVYVPYKGTAQMMTDVMANRSQTMFGSVLSSLGHIKAGKMRPIAISMNQRSSVLPDVPTVAEQGYPAYDLNTWHGWSAPAGTPRPIVTYLSAELARMVKSPDVAKKLLEDGGIPVGSSPDEFASLISTEITRWTALVKKMDLNQ